MWHLFGTKQKGCHRSAMRLPPECYQMRQTIQYHLPHLRESQSLGLTLWVYGTILMGSACQNTVATALSFMGSFETMRQYLRQWLYDGQHKPRPTATRIDVELCFAPLLRWVLCLWTVGQTGVGNRPDDEGRPDKLDSHKRGLSKLRYSGGLARSGSEQTGRVDSAHYEAGGSAV